MNVGGHLYLARVTHLIHPWRRLRALAEWTLIWHDGGPLGVTKFADKTISLRRGLTQAERRSVILHECLHAERGPALSTLAGREEQFVRRHTARLLMPDIKMVGDALAWARDLDEAASELWVDRPTLEDRLRWLHPAELHYLRRRLDDFADDGAPA